MCAFDPVNLPRSNLFSFSELTNTIEPKTSPIVVESSSNADQHGQRDQLQQEQWPAEVSRAEIEMGELDNAPEQVIEPIQMEVDLVASERTMPGSAVAWPDKTSSVDRETSQSSSDQQHQNQQRQQQQQLQQNPQVVNSLPLKP